MTTIADIKALQKKADDAQRAVEAAKVSFIAAHSPHKVGERLEYEATRRVNGTSVEVTATMLVCKVSVTTGIEGWIDTVPEFKFTGSLIRKDGTAGAVRDSCSIPVPADLLGE